MCDVLVSLQVVNYDNVPPDDQIPREQPFSVSPWLKKIFSQPAHWPDYVIRERLTNNDMLMPNAMSGMILSGPMNHFVDPAVNTTVTVFLVKQEALKCKELIILQKTQLMPSL